jgi:hypothetical protein
VAQQAPAGPPAQPQARQQQPLSPQQLETLVAPVALYPDNLLSQVLVASTYPLEIVEANQWLQQNGNLSGQQLVNAARQQPWDASIQAMVMFPDVLGRLASNVQWTTDLGNAFLAQQADVMRAVQMLRKEAQANGRLNSNAEQTVTDQSQGGQSAVEIQPANPDEVYVPEYNPEYMWGPPPDYGYYPDLDYVDDFGYGFYPGVYIGGFWPGFGWGGWGWWPNWFGCDIFLRAGFFNHFGFGGGWGYGHGWGGRGGVWAHDPAHRMGVPYSNRTLASRYGGTSAGVGRVSAGRVAQNLARGGSAGVARGGAGGAGWQRFGSSAGGGQYRGSSGGNSYQGYRSSSGYGSGYGAARGYSSNAYGSARPSYSYGGASAFRSSGSYGGGYRSNPSYGGGYHYAAPSSHSSGGGGFHSSGGGGFHSSGGGGFHSGGGGGGSHGGGGGRR